MAAIFGHDNKHRGNRGIWPPQPPQPEPRPQLRRQNASATKALVRRHDPSSHGHSLGHDGSLPWQQRHFISAISIVAVTIHSSAHIHEFQRSRPIPRLRQLPPWLPRYLVTMISAALSIALTVMTKCLGDHDVCLMP